MCAKYLNVSTLESWINVLARNMFFGNFQRNTLLLQTYTIKEFWAEKKIPEFFEHRYVFWSLFRIMITDVYSVPKYVLLTYI